MDAKLINRKIYELYKQITLDNKLLVLLSEKEFYDLQIKSEVIYMFDGEEALGFVFFNIVEDKSYITFLYGKDDIKVKLLQNTEKILKEKNITSLWVSFFNPTALSWYPKPGIIHPTIQGVVLDSEEHQFYQKHGFINHTIEDTYYQKLSEFEVPNNIKKTIYENQTKGYNIEYYDEYKHHGLIDFCEEIHAPHWKKVILSNHALKNPLPLLVVTHFDKVVGFTGPLENQKNGRGYFAGIGVLQSYQGKKLGKTLFYRLCEELKLMGAQYMTLFTGRNNPAKHIYVSAGFVVVKSFMIIKKFLKGESNV